MKVTSSTTDTNNVGTDTNDVANCTADSQSTPAIGSAHPRFTSYKLTKRDEFSGTSIDTNLWRFDTNANQAAHNAGWGNNELQYYTGATDDNAYISDCVLVIEAKSENLGGKQYTSARLHTHGTLKVVYGVIEARIKLPANASGQTDAGTWPAFWLLGDNFNGWGHDAFGGNTAWPQAGEIDIMETNTKENGYSTVLSTIHFANSSNTHEYSGNAIPITNATSEYHIYTLVWEDSQMTFYLDYNQIYTVSIATSDKTEFKKEFFLLLNLAVGGHFVNAPDPSKYPQKMYVDYVRIYQK